MATSLGLYMLGTAVSPVAVSLFQSYTASFAAALAIFGITLAYLVIYIDIPAPQAMPQVETYSSKILSGVGILLSPLRSFLDHPHAIPYGLSLLLYTAVQAHLFPAIMVFASIRLHFSAFQNGLLVSIAAACASVSLFLIHHAPRAMAKAELREAYRQHCYTRSTSHTDACSHRHHTSTECWSTIPSCLRCSRRASSASVLQGPFCFTHARCIASDLGIDFYGESWRFSVAIRTWKLAVFCSRTFCIYLCGCGTGGKPRVVSLGRSTSLHYTNCTTER